MRKFWHVIYIIIMRILFFIILLAMSPMWILFGIYLAFAMLFGEGDDFFDPDYYEHGKLKGREYPEYVEKMDKPENNPEVPSNN